MISVNVKNGYSLNIKGAPSKEAIQLPPPTVLAFVPDRIPYIKPRLRVKPGDQVKIGSILFEDKRNTDIVFRSPAGGRIKDIVYGPRRVIQQVIITRNSEEDAESFVTFPDADLIAIPRQDLVTAITNGGLWHVFRELPFRDIPDPETLPPAIVVRLSNTEPFHPLPEVYLEGKTDLLQFGLRVLKKLSKQILICASGTGGDLPDDIRNTITHTVSGPYPSDDPGVVVYHTKKDAGLNKAWFITGQDLLLLAHLLKHGTYPVERTVAVGGDVNTGGGHIHTRLGAPIAHILSRAAMPADVRCITGGVLTGCTTSSDGFLGFYETAVTLIPSGSQDEFFGFLRPGYNKPSRSRTFLSVFRRSPADMDCGMHGEERACVNCSTCARVCPVDILPQFTMKSIHADEVEEALAHGLLDCVSCGLCTYVCPSKIELADILKKAKADYLKE